MSGLESNMHARGSENSNISESSACINNELKLRNKIDQRNILFSSVASLNTLIDELNLDGCTSQSDSDTFNSSLKEKERMQDIFEYVKSNIVNLPENIKPEWIKQVNKLELLFQVKEPKISYLEGLKRIFNSDLAKVEGAPAGSNLRKIEEIKSEQKKQESKSPKQVVDNKTQVQEKIFQPKLNSSFPTLNRYYNKSIINSRGDINNINFLKQLYQAVDRGEITQLQQEQVLEDGYYLAFSSEFKSKEGKIGIDNIKTYESQWREIFGDELSEVVGNRRKAEDLFLLSWIEGNGIDQEKNSAGAIGWFQILLSTAQSVDSSIVKSDLHDPIKSAKIAAKYLKILIINTKKDKPELNTDEVIQLAITKYNGNFTSRLQSAYRGDIQKTIFDLYKDLNWIEKCAGKKEGFKEFDEVVTKIKQVHKKYYNSGEKGVGGIYRDPNSNNTHLGVLDLCNSGKIKTIPEIKAKIEQYIKNIMKQQFMYPVQLNATKRAYEDTK